MKIGNERERDKEKVWENNHVFAYLILEFRGLSQELTKVVEKLFFSSQGKIHKGGQRTRDKFALR